MNADPLLVFTMPVPTSHSGSCCSPPPPPKFKALSMPPLGLFAIKPMQSYQQQQQHQQQQQQTAAQKKLARPRGLWKARGTQSGAGHAGLLSPHTSTPARSPTPALLAFSSEYPHKHLRPHSRSHPLHPANGSASDYFEYHYSSDDSSFSSRASSPGTGIVGSSNHHHHSITSTSTTPTSDTLARPHKRRRVSSSATSVSCCSECEVEREEEQVIYWDYARSKACAPAYPSHDRDQDRCAENANESKWTTRSKLMDTSSIGIGTTRFVAPAASMQFDVGVGPGYTMQSVPGPPGPQATFDLEDWEDLKELFAKTAEMYETHPPEETLPLLRGVIHECHRFMLVYPDPSVLYTTPPHSDSELDPSSGREHHHHHHHHGPYYYHDKGKGRELPIPVEWLTTDPPPLYPPRPQRQESGVSASVDTGIQADPATASSAPSTTTPAPKKCKCKDLPTAFYTILGTTLFFFGTIIQSHPSLALEGEPNYPTPYWLAALDVFEIGEGLPVRISGYGRGGPPLAGYGYAYGGMHGLSSALSGMSYSASTGTSMGINTSVSWGCGNGPPEDWRMAVMWGRTLVCIAEEVLRREREGEKKKKKKGVEMGNPMGPGDRQQQPYHSTISPAGSYLQQEGSSYFYGFSNPPLSTSHASPASITSPPTSTTTTTTTPSSINPPTLGTPGTPFSPFTTSPSSHPFSSPPIIPPISTQPDEPIWPPNSPFAAIIARRPPLTTRVSLAGDVDPDELLQLAQDQFSRGILHMPHLQHLAPRLFRQGSSGLLEGGGGLGEKKKKKSAAPGAISAVSSTSTTASAATTTSTSTRISTTTTTAASSTSQTPNPNSISTHLPSPSTFSRAKELYNIASSVLLLAEKLPSRRERQVWAGWADSVLAQMKLELESTAASGVGGGGGAGDTNTMMYWRGVVWAARGRACVVVGSALAEGVEERLEDGDEAEQRGVLESEEARDARDVLGEAVGYLERAKEEIEERKRERHQQEGEKQRRHGAPPHVHVHRHRVHVKEEIEHEEEEEDGENEEMVISLEQAEGDDDGGDVTIIPTEEDEEMDEDDDEDDEDPSPSSPSSSTTARPPAAKATARITIAPPPSKILPPPPSSSSSTAPSSLAPAAPPLTPDAQDEEDLEELGTLLAEALLSLANLTADERERERLYERAKREGGDKVVFDDDDDDDDDEGDRMDESG